MSMKWKLAGAMLTAASLLIGTGCRSHETRTQEADVRVDVVAVELEGQPDPWWNPRPPKRRGDGVPAQAPAQEAPRAAVVTDGRGSVSAAYPTGDARTSAILVEKFFPRTVTAGAPFDYEIRVTNLTSLDLDNVQIWDAIPNNFRLISADPSVTSQDAGTLMWMLGAMGPGEVRTIKVRGSAPAEGKIQACAKVAYDTSLCNEILVVQPALTLAVETVPEVSICDMIPVKYTVCNTGSGAATNVVVTETLPDGLTVNGSREVRFTVATLAAGQCQDFTVMAKAGKTGTFTVDGGAAADNDLSATAEAKRTVVRQPVLAIEVECPSQVLAGASVREVQIKVTVKNTGDMASANTVVESAMPAGARFVRASDGGVASGSTVQWALGSLAPNATKTFTYAVVPDARGAQQVSARAQGVCANPVNAQCSFDVKGIPAVLLEVVDLDDPIRVGDEVTYRITVTNQGSAQDTNIRIVATLEDNITFVRASGQHRVNGKRVEFAAVPVLAAKQQVTFEVTVRATGGGDTRFFVEMNTDELGRPVNETEATQFYE